VVVRSLHTIEDLNDTPVRLGVIGCGGFGLFALQQFTQVSGDTLAGMAGTHRPAALAAAAWFGVENVEDTDDLLRRDDVDIVYIATPPFLHSSWSRPPGGATACSSPTP
jgi:predicted dehydrogenase